MTSRQDHDRKLFERLHVSIADIGFARYCAEVLLENKWHYQPAERSKKVYRHQAAFVTALVVSYGRAFTNSRGWPDFPGRLRSVFSDEDKKLHNKLLELRHAVYAHSDSASYVIEPKFVPKAKGYYIAGKFPQMMLTPAECNRFQAMAKALMRKIEERRNEVAASLGAIP